MKKIRKLFLPVFLAAAMTFSACSLPNSSNSTSVQVDEEGAVTETIIEEKDGDYTEEELTDYIRQSVRRYDAGDESKVSLDSCKISGNSVTIVMKYGSVEDYSGFNQVPMKKAVRQMHLIRSRFRSAGRNGRFLSFQSRYTYVCRTKSCTRPATSP